MSIRISHPSILPFLEASGSGKVHFDGGRIRGWECTASEEGGAVFLSGAFDEETYFNQIKIAADRGAFPSTFRFEISVDGNVWEPIFKETGFVPAPDGAVWTFPLIRAKYVKLVAQLDGAADRIGLGDFQVMVAGVVRIDTSSDLDRLWVKDNLIDGRPDYGWSSALRPKNQEEFIEMDLGSINRLTEVRLLSKDDADTFFPAAFRILYSDDHITWHHLIEENGFFAEPGTWYRWRFLPLNIRYLMIQIRENARTREGKYLSQIIEVELHATADPVERQERGLPEPVPHASVLRSGIVRLAMDGEVKEGAAVQASDRRLRNATTDARGIVELAQDGEEREGVVVQGHDRRLRLASEDMPGIVRLARNREERAGHAVQSNDPRLRRATTESEGVVELAEHGEDRGGVAVQGSDPRLRGATEKLPGIVRLAADGESQPALAVQSSDSRLRRATTEDAGILRFAREGEASSSAAVQGSDPRLRVATTETPGIVELGSDGEEREGVVVQGHDRRLKPATEERPGILRFCPPGSAVGLAAVQGNDPRLSDARVPVSHSHEYAPIEHDFASHQGMIRLERNTGKAYEGHVPPPADHAPVAGVNAGGGSGLSGRAETDGVLGFGHQSGLRGVSDRGAGAAGESFSGPGGRFSSARFFDVATAPKPVLDPGILVHGYSRLVGSVFAGSGTGDSCLAVYLPVQTSDVVLPGDVLIASTLAGQVQKCNHRASPRVVGVAVERASVVFNPPAEMFPSGPGEQGVLPEGRVLVAFAGLVQARVCAESGAVEPGDLLVSSFQAGCLEKISARDGGEQPGRIVGRALGAVKKGEALIPVLLSA